MNFYELGLNAAGGAIAAGLAGLVAVFVRKRWPANQWAYLGAFLVVFSVLFPAMRIGVIPALTQQSREAEGQNAFAQMPLYRVLLEKHPEIKPQLDAAVALVARDPTQRDAVQSMIVQAVLPYFQRYVGQTSDAALDEFLTFYMGMLEKLRDSDPQTCLALLRGQGSGYDRYVAKDQQMPMMLMIERVVVDAIERPAGKMDQAAFEAATNKVIEKLSSSMTIENPDAVDPTNPRAEPKAACAFTVAVIRTAQSELGADAPTFLRTMLAAGQ